MDTPPPIPLQVQPLAYETPAYSPWGKIVKAIATLGLLQGCCTILITLSSAMSGSGMMRAGPGYMVAVACALLASGAAGLAMLVAAIMMMQRANATTPMLVSALAIAGAKILLAIINIIVMAMQIAPRGMGSPYLSYLAYPLFSGAQGALLPVMIAALVMIGRNEEGYRRVFLRQ